MAIPQIQVIVKGDAKESLYRFSRAKKTYGYDEFLAELVKKYDVKVSEVGKILEEVFEDARESMGGAAPEYYMPVLSDDLVGLFNAFRWHSAVDGTSSIYVLSSPNETYVLTIDPMVTASALPCGSGSLEDYMTREYLKLAQQGSLPFIGDDSTNDRGETKKGPVIVPTLSEYWETHIKKVWSRDSRFRLPHRPKEISTDPEVPSFFYWDDSQVVSGPHPTWDMWLENLPPYCRPLFRAYVYSIFDPYNKGRQALWMYDQGYSGKSSVLRAVTKFMGLHAVGSISQGSLADKFAYSSLYGKRLVVYGDNKDPKLLHKEKVHSLLGGDMVQIERKNIQAFMGEVHAKLWVSANCSPEVDLGSRSEITRIIQIPLQEPPEHVMARFCQTDSEGRVLRQRDGSPVFIGGNLEAELIPEIPHFLHACKKDYEELCPNRMDIILSDEAYEALHTSCASPEHMSVERFLEEELEFDPSYSLKPGDLQEVFSEWTKGRSNTFDYSRLKSFLESQKGCRSIRENGKPRMMRGVRLKAVGIQKVKV